MLKVRMVQPDLVERRSTPNTSPAHTTLRSASPSDEMGCGATVNILPLMAPGSGFRALRLRLRSGTSPSPAADPSPPAPFAASASRDGTFTLA